MYGYNHSAVKHCQCFHSKIHSKINYYKVLNISTFSLLFNF